MKRHKRFLFTIVAIVLGLALLEGSLQLFWLVAGGDSPPATAPRAVEFKEDFHARHDADLGWAHIPGKHLADFYGPGRHITINAEGYRAGESYRSPPPPERFRVVCLGDSFTLGYGVDDAATYPAQLEELNPAVQAVNMGQGGYSIGQCYLWYQQDGASLRANALVAAFILDDIWRMTGGRMANGAAMPGFEFSGGQLRVTGQPVPEKITAGERLDASSTLGFLTEHSALFRTADWLVAPLRRSNDEIDRTKQLQVAMAILGALHEEATRKGVPMVLVLLPELAELQDPARRALYRQISRAILNSARQAGIPCVELSGAFLASGKVEELYLDEQWHHFSEAGNRLVAEQIDQFLQKTLSEYPQGR